MLDYLHTAEPKVEGFGDTISSSQYLFVGQGWCPNMLRRTEAPCIGDPLTS